MCAQEYNMVYCIVRCSACGIWGQCLDMIGLKKEDFATLTRTVLQIADAYTQGRVVSILEGGYNTRVLADCVALHLRELMKDV